MEQHIGENYEGIVSGVTAWGLFVELENSCEGMIRAASMNDDFYVYDEDHMKLVGESTHKEYVLGQKVMIKVLGADRITRTIDFRIVDENEDEDSFDQYGYDPDDFVVYSEARKIAENRANKIRKVIERSKDEADSAKAQHREASFGIKGKDSKAKKSDAKKTKKTKKDKSEGRLVEYKGEMIDLSLYEPDPVTGDLQPKHRGKKHSPATGKTIGGRRRTKDKADKDKETSSSGRKVYKVHKYKKSATSKAARSAQSKGRKRK